MGIVLLVLLGGCASIVAVVANSGLLDSFRGPMDTANAYLDAARTSTGVNPHACRADAPVDDAVRRSQGQRLNEVNVQNNVTATVRGSLTLADGQRVPVLVDLRRPGEQWCVDMVFLN